MITDYLLSERYQVGDVIGQGTMSVVLRGRDTRLGRDVAIKVLRDDLVGDARYVARFRHEAANASMVNHPALLAVYDTGETKGAGGTVPFIVMQYVAGQTLQDTLAAQGRFEPGRAVAIAITIAAALDFSHRHGVVHRNISPRKVMLAQDDADNAADAGNDQVTVMDFGIARAVTDDAGPPTRATVGQAEYLSPEHARGEPIDARSDVYSVGCILYEMLTGQPPFTGTTAEGVAAQHVRSAPRPPSRLVPGLDPELDVIVATALNKRPLDRYQSAAALHQALTSIAARVSGDGPASRPAEPVMMPSGASAPLLAPTGLMVVHDDDHEPAGPRRWNRLAGFAAIAVVCAAILAGAVWLTAAVVTAEPTHSRVAVPDLSGKTVDEATAIIHDKGLSLGSVTRIESNQDSADKVLVQRPSGLTQVDPKTVINVQVGRGVTLATVPNLVGSTTDDARKFVAQAHLQYAEQQQPSADVDKGRVLAQDVGPQTEVSPDSTVTVTVGTGTAMVAVPDSVVGKTVVEATRILQEARLEVVQQDADGTEPAGQVIGLDHPSGQEVPEGTPVTLSVSNNSLMVVPDLQGQTPDEAAGNLQRVGWAGDTGTLSTKGEPAPANRVGRVVNQDPASGTVVHKTGTPIQVGVGVRQITVPNVVGKNRDTATDLLRKAGATKVDIVSGGQAPRGQAGRVTAQSVPPNALVGADAPIVITIYNG